MSHSFEYYFIIGGGLIWQNWPIDTNPELFVWRHIYRAGISQKFPSCSMFDPMYMGSEVSIEKGPKLLRKSWKNGKSWISSQKKLHLISYFTIATYPIDYNRILKHFGWIKSLACFFEGSKRRKMGFLGYFRSKGNTLNLWFSQNALKCDYSLWDG